jgi:hypothetical protein
VIEDPDAPASQMIRQAARGIVASTPVELPVMQVPQAVPAATTTAPGSNGGGVSGTELPMVQ